MPQNFYIMVLTVLGSINGLALSIFFVFGSKRREKHLFFLAGLFLALTIKISKSVVFNALPIDSYKNGYVTLSILAVFLIGPLLYLYVSNYLGQNQKNTQWKNHLGINTLIISSIMFYFPYWDNTDLWNDKIVFLLYFQRLAYLVFSGILIKKHIGLLIPKAYENFKDLIWLKGIFWGMVLLWVGSTLILSGIGNRLVTTVLFLFMVYSLFAILVYSPNAKRLILYPPRPKYGNSKILYSEADRILESLSDLMSENQIYKNPNLKISDTSQFLNISSRELSQLLNDKLNKNFNRYINEFRVKKAQELILKNDEYTLEAIGHESGFKSKSTFYSTFKKLTGKTPNEFKKSKK